ncbi:MAG: hypothetical protein FWC39_12810 [Bacteroidetes bacterium]|nr:hypothetical protein [Bacteroidota bacterium]
MKIKKHILFFCCILAFSANAQEKNWTLSGYVSGMPSGMMFSPNPESDWDFPSAEWQALLHNRLNFGWQINKDFRFDAGMRNRFIAGSEMMINPESISADAGLVDLSWNYFSTNNTILNTTFDRLNFTFEKNKWKLQLGRQRINWGQTFVWNPNDIFNTYSFFDFDYPERPGCDAFRTTYFHNATSSSEFAVSANHDKKVTAALLHRCNKKNVDYQLIAGVLTETDIVVGGALTSDYKGLNYRTELSYFHSIVETGHAPSLLAVSAGLDYIFKNQLMLQTEILYNNVDTNNAGGLMAMYAAPLSAKNLSISQWNVFTNASYPVTPRLNGTLSGMYFVDIQSFYAGLSLDFSVAENLDFSFIAQYFSTLGNAALGDMHVLMGFARLKYSF